MARILHVYDEIAKEQGYSKLDIKQSKQTYMGHALANWIEGERV